MPEQPQEESLLMKVLCALLLLLMAGVVTLTALAQEIHEGSTSGTSTSPPARTARPSLPIGPHGHMAVPKKSKRRLPVRRRRQVKVLGVWLESL